MNQQNTSIPGVSTLWRTMDKATIEREYSPSSVIGGNYQPFIDDYQRLSEKARTACDRIETFHYGSGIDHSIDIAMPRLSNGAAGDRRTSPLIVFIHGGYWQECSKQESFFGADYFTAQGIAYAAIDYTLAPKASLAEIVGECRQALHLIFERAETFGIDAKQVYLAGSSAGGHLCAMCCSTAGDTGALAQRVAGVILLSGVFELEPLVGTSINEAVGMNVEDARQNSPQLLDANLFPPSIVAWGEQETTEFKRQSLAFAHKLEESSRSVVAFECPGRNHFDLVHDMANPTTKLGKSILQLIKHRQ